jgi:hypothetical protein
MSNQTSEAFAYIEQEYKDAKGRVELQRRVVEQVHMIEADASEADLRILDYLRKWLGDTVGRDASQSRLATDTTGAAEW